MDKTIHLTSEEFKQELEAAWKKGFYQPYGDENKRSRESHISCRIACISEPVTQPPKESEPNENIIFCINEKGFDSCHHKNACSMCKDGLERRKFAFQHPKLLNDVKEEEPKAGDVLVLEESYISKGRTFYAGAYTIVDYESTEPLWIESRDGMYARPVSEIKESGVKYHINK